jgi:hypothetical protein
MLWLRALVIVAEYQRALAVRRVIVPSIDE